MFWVPAGLVGLAIAAYVLGRCIARHRYYESPRTIDSFYVASRHHRVGHFDPVVCSCGTRFRATTAGQSKCSRCRELALERAKREARILEFRLRRLAPAEQPGVDRQAHVPSVVQPDRR